MFNKVFYVTHDNIYIEEFIFELGMPLPSSTEFVTINEKSYFVLNKDFDYDRKVIVIVLRLEK